MKATTAIATFIALASFVAILVGEPWQAEVMLLVSTLLPLPLWALATALTALRTDDGISGNTGTHLLLFSHAAYFACSCANAYLWLDAATKGSHENFAAVFLILVAVFQAGTLLVSGVALRFAAKTRRLSRQAFVGLGLYVGAWIPVIAAAAFG